MVTQDIYINATLYIAQIDLNDDGTSTISLTEGCNHPKAEACDHKIYDFTEVIL